MSNTLSTIQRNEINTIRPVLKINPLTFSNVKTDIADKIGPILVNNFYVLPPVNGTLQRYFTGDFYYRIYVIPKILINEDAKIGEENKYIIWNAYLVDNHIVSVDTIDAQGLNNTAQLGDVYKPVELKSNSITITDDAPALINATYTFNFYHGKGAFQFKASTSVKFAIPSMYPVSEKWSWYTDILQSYNGNEQRISLRAYPRMITTATWELNNYKDIVTFKTKLFNKILTKTTTAYFHNQTFPTKQSLKDEKRIYFDNTILNIRKDDNIQIIDDYNNLSYIFIIDTLYDDGADLTKPLSFDLKTNMAIIPSYISILQDNNNINMSNITGDLRLTLINCNNNKEIIRPFDTTQIQYIDNMAILTYRNLLFDVTSNSRKTINAQYDFNVNSIDNKTGVQNFYTTWNNSFERIEFNHLIDNLDWWRQFLDYTKGSYGAFIYSSWREDFELAEPIGDSSTKIVIKNSPYFNSMYNLNILKYLHIHHLNKETYKVIKSTEVNDQDNLIIEFTTPIDNYPIESFISAAFIYRILNDNVLFTHRQIDKYITFQLQQVLK